MSVTAERVFDESKHPRDPGGEGGGQWIPKWVDANGKPTKGEIVPLDPKRKPFRDISLLHADTPAGRIGFATRGDVGTDNEYHERIFALRDSDNQTLGHLDLVHHDDNVMIEMIEVDPEFRRKKIGTALLSAARYVNQGKKIGVAGDFATDAGRAFLKSQKMT